MACVFVVGFDLLAFGGWAPDVARCWLGDCGFGLLADCIGLGCFRVC